MKKKLASLLVVIFTLTTLVSFAAVKPSVKPVSLQTKSGTAMSLAANYLSNEIKKNPNTNTDFDTVSLKYAGKIPTSYISNKYKNIDKNLKSKYLNDYVSSMLGIMAAGYDPTSFNGYDLPYIVKNLMLPTGEFKFSLDKEQNYVNPQVWAIIGLEASKTPYDRHKAVLYLKSLQNKDGGFPIIEKTQSDADMTAMSVVALTMSGESKYSPTVSKALSYLKVRLTKLQKTPNFESSETLSQIVIAVVSAKDNINNYRINGKNVVEELLTYQVKGSGFKHLKAGAVNKIATEQAIRALAAYKTNKNIYSGLSYTKNKFYNSPKATVTVRVEGYDKTILKDINVSVGNKIVFDGSGKYFETKAKVSSYAAVARAINESKLVSETSYEWGSPFITSIGGESQGKFGGYDGWLYLINGIDPGATMSDVQIKNGDSIIVYYGDWGIKPLIITVPSQVQKGQQFEVIVKSIDGTIVSNADVVISGERFKTDDSGKAAITLNNAGTFEVYAEKNDVDGKPELIRSDVKNVVVK